MKGGDYFEGFGLNSGIILKLVSSSLCGCELVSYVYLNINQLDALNFLMSLFQASTCFEHHVLIVKEVKIVLYSLWYHHTETSE